ncbi:cytochrome P450 [Pseudonocardia ailaonensis]|uniref:Cytochrome P450 n=1 Tax=Pseudonocardia ailaonensis TaxID=367279 RepID=A0ABN2MV58_9PSEU
MDRCPVVSFDHNSAAHASDPAGDYRRLRAEAAVGYTEAHGGYWILADYASVFDAARDDSVFSSRRSEHGGTGLSVLIPKTPSPRHIPIEMDPPEFRGYRRIVNEIASPSAVAKLKPMIAGYVTRFVDGVIEAGECDFGQLVKVPAVVTVDWLGLPLSHWERFAFAHHTVVAEVAGSPNYRQATEVDFPELHALIRATIAERRADPGDDLISWFVRQEVPAEDGTVRVLDDDEVFGIVDLLLAGGVDTTASLVGQTLVWLDRHHDVRQRLIDEPELLPRAIEEFLRFFAPAPALARTIAKDAPFHGCTLKEGDRALLAWASANRDPAQFENPDTLDIDRWPNRHLSFGLGVHRCVGSHLGRAMAQQLLGEVLRRMPDYRIDHDGVVAYPQQGSSAGFGVIPATFTPGAREGA